MGKEDLFKHSKWISFMERRLAIAKELLGESGLIFVSIDDNELYNLKLLLDEVFGEVNYIATLPTVMNLKGNQDQFGFAGTHEYTLVYSKNRNRCSLGSFSIDDEKINDEWTIDEVGYFKKGANLKATGVNGPREKRPNLFYPVYITGGPGEYCVSVDDSEKAVDTLVPITKGEEMSWRWSKDKMKKEANNVIVVKSSDGGFSLYKKQRPELGNLPTQKPKSVWYKPEYSSGNGTKLLKEIFNKKIFNNPKPLQLIKDIIHLSTSNDSIILDFFAGSGTTGHAVLELNKEDGGKRKFILATNNENNICEDITYRRIKNVIEGYSDVSGIPTNLKYYKTKYIPKFKNNNTSEALLDNIKELIQLEFHTSIDDEKVLVVFNDEELDRIFERENLKLCEKLFVPSDVLFTSEQEKLVNDLNIDVIEIPQYYYAEELKEVHEL